MSIRAISASASVTSNTPGTAGTGRTAHTSVKTDLSPVEAVLVEQTLMSSWGRTDAMASIQRLTTERQALYRLSAARPEIAATNTLRIRALTSEIEHLWSLVRRSRAERRVFLEAALHVTHRDAGSEQSVYDEGHSTNAA